METTEVKDKYYKSEYVYVSERSIVWKEITRFLQKYVPNNSSVLDLGAGYCDFINNVKAEKKYALDISPELSKHANKDVVVINSSVLDLNQVSTDSVDIVHASNLLEHFDDKELEVIMKEIKRVLKKGGKLILMQPNYALSYKKYFDDPTHKKVFSDTSLEVFLKMYGMEIILKKSRFLPFSMKSNTSLFPKFILPFVVRVYIYSPWKPFAGQMLFVSKNIK